MTQHVVQANRQLKHERAGGQNMRKIASKIVQTLSVSLIVFPLVFFITIIEIQKNIFRLASLFLSILYALRFFKGYYPTPVVRIISY